MTRDEIIKFLESRKDLHRSDIERHRRDKLEALEDKNLEKANKYQKWEFESFMLEDELDYIISVIKKSDISENRSN